MAAPSPRLAAVVAVGLASLAVWASAATAGSYDVVACDAAGGVNNSWGPVVGNTLAVVAYTECPTGGEANRGMVARNIVSANSAASGSVVAQMKFTAPPGTTIVGLHGSYDFYRADAQWEAALSTGSQLLRGCAIGGPSVCAASSPDEWIDVPGGSQVLYIDVYCTSSGCPLDSGDASHSYLTARARLASAAVRLQDDSPPTITSITGPLWTDGWKNATQTLTVDATDNAGIRQTAVLLDGQNAGQSGHPCDATLVIPCPNGKDGFPVNTASFADGRHRLEVQAVDSAGNLSSAARDVLIDNSPPGPPQGLVVDGGEGWRSQNAFALHWANPPAAGAPLAGVQWQLCPAGSQTGCVAGAKDGATVATLNGLAVPRDGDWTVKLWLRDAATNNTINNAAGPLHLRVDREAPTAVFSPSDPADPTRVVVQASDATSGVASGSIDFKAHDATDWTTVAAHLQGGRLVAILPDETMADGVYDLRGHAVDQAGNERGTTTLADGSPLTATLPLRAPTHLVAGHLQTRRRHRRRIRYLATRLRLGYGHRTRLQGRLADKDNKSMAQTPVVISELLDLPGASWQPLRTVTTDRYGNYRLRTTKRGASRTVRVRYEGTPTVRPSQADVGLAVAASSTLHLSRHRVKTGHAVRFFGTLRGGHVPKDKQVQLQVLVGGRWQVFANARAKANGAWSSVYKFTGSYRSARYAFRARIPKEANYPFATGHTSTATIHVSGR